MPNPALTVEVDRAIDDLARNVLAATPYARIGPPLAVTFPASGSAVDIQHQLGVIPDGYLIVWADAEIHATPTAQGKFWTSSIAYLQANANNAHATICFVTLRGSVANA